ncbi:MAG: HAD family hydrolase [Akkermansia sp.]|nr:HAD hydrolase family protein [Akkermansia sp.]
MEAVEEGYPVPGPALPWCGPCRWLISLDYDGTLRGIGEPGIDPAFFDLMRDLRPQGVRWGINTGRSLPYLLSDYAPRAPFLPDFICTCERYTYVADETGRLLPAEEHNAECRSANLHLREHLRQPMAEMADLLHARFPSLSWQFAATDPLSIEAEDAAAMEVLAPLPEALAARFPGVAVQRAGRYLRFCDARFHKGTALAYVTRAWGLPPQRLLLMGDAHNDLDAFRSFPGAFCAAPASAHPDVLAWLRAHGGYISPANGVIETIRTCFVGRKSVLNPGFGLTL